MNNKKISHMMLFINFICDLLFSLSYPYIYAETVRAVSKRYISIEQILLCVGTIFLGILWRKFGDKLFKHYLLIVIIEIISDIILFTHVLVTNNLRFYFIFNIIVCAFITKNISNCEIKLRAKVHPDEKSRERYDINCNIVNSSASILGAIGSIILKPSINILFVLAFIGNIFNNICYYYIYIKVEALEAEKESKNENCINWA